MPAIAYAVLGTAHTVLRGLCDLCCEAAIGLSELSVQRAFGNPHQAGVVCHQGTHDSFLAAKGGVRCAGWRLGEHQVQQCPDDVQVGGFGALAQVIRRALCEESFVLALKGLVGDLRFRDVTLAGRAGGAQDFALDEQHLNGLDADGWV